MSDKTTQKLREIRQIVIKIDLHVCMFITYYRVLKYVSDKDTPFEVLYFQCFHSFSLEPSVFQEREAEKCPKFKNILKTCLRLKKDEELLS